MNQSDQYFDQSSNGTLIGWRSTGDDELGVRLHAQGRFFVVRIRPECISSTSPILLPVFCCSITLHMYFLCSSPGLLGVSSVRAVDLSMGTELLPPYKVILLPRGSASSPVWAAAGCSNACASSSDPDPESQWLVCSHSSGCFGLQPQRQSGNVSSLWRWGARGSVARLLTFLL